MNHQSDDMPETQDVGRASPFGSAILQVDQSVVAAGACQVLPLLGIQLKEVATDLEQSVMGICQGFQGISRRSQEVVQQAEQAIAGGENNQGGDQLIASAHQTLSTLLEKVQSSCEFVNSQSNRINELESQLFDVEKALKRVEQISNQAKLVALNGQIEAARLGESGKSFSVVAEETKVLAANASMTSETIQSLISQLGSTLRSTAADLHSRTKQDFEALADSQVAVTSMLNRLQQANDAMSRSLENTTELSRQMQKDVGRSVIAMQFQDRLNQRIDHIIEAIKELSIDLSPFQQDLDADDVEQLVHAWTQWFAKRSTMRSEIDAMNSTNNSSSASQDALSTVELF